MNGIQVLGARGIHGKLNPQEILEIALNFPRVRSGGSSQSCLDDRSQRNLRRPQPPGTPTCCPPLTPPGEGPLRERLRNYHPARPLGGTHPTVLSLPVCFLPPPLDSGSLRPGLEVFVSDPLA